KYSGTKSSGRSSPEACAWRKALHTRNRSSASRPTPPELSNTTNYRKRSSDVSKQRGLPSQRRMRHDFHFLDNLTSGPATGLGQGSPQHQPYRESAAARAQFVRGSGRSRKTLREVPVHARGRREEAWKIQNLDHRNAYAQ